jgi:hypothetical protein
MSANNTIPDSGRVQVEADVIIPSRLVLTEKGAKDLLRHLNKPGRPTKAMRELMAGKLKDEPPA